MSSITSRSIVTKFTQDLVVPGGVADGNFRKISATASYR